MKELTFETLIAVFEEIFGRGMFWTMVIAALVVTLAYVFVMVRDRAISWNRFLYAQMAMPVGALAAVGFVLKMTNSAPSDLGGPIDIILFLAVATAGALGAAILVYTVQSLIRPPH